MAKRSPFGQGVLWGFVLAAGILTGGSIFEHTVLTPLWAGSLPESVTQWPHGIVQAAFFKIVTPLYGLISLVLVIVAWWMPRQQRRWALVAGVSGIVVLVWTIVYFLPILGKTQATRGAGLSGEEIRALATQFKVWSWGRWAVLIGSWVAGLVAFSRSPSDEGEPAL